MTSWTTLHLSAKSSVWSDVGPGRSNEGPGHIKCGPGITDGFPDESVKHFIKIIEYFDLRVY